MELKRKWKYNDYEKPSDASCYDCILNYKDAGDCVISNDLWEKINPSEDIGGGILCPNCILRRLHEIGISGIDAKLW